jgi:hypothetical protein
VRTQEYSRRPGQGRKRATTAVQDRFLMIQTLREWFITAPRLQNMLTEAQCSCQFRYHKKRLRGFNLTPKTPAKGPQLTADHRRARLTFAQEHVNWSRAR